jgi:hypothetical protein
MHELYGKVGSFITLTYNCKNLPEGETLVKEHLQLFIKRLRKHVEPLRIKYYACGEYGDETHRPHYHIIIIAWHPDIEQCYRPDKKRLASRELESLWRYGNNVVGSADREAIQYVVGYIRKKLVGIGADYGDRLPPFALQSKGIGKEYVESHKEAILSDRGITRNGVNVILPRYYKKKLMPEGSAELQRFREKCSNKINEAIDKYPDIGYYRQARESDADRRRANYEAREKLFKKGVF